MLNLIQHLETYAKNSTFDRIPTAFLIAQEYERLKQYAGAIAFYTKCSESTKDQKLAYTCLLKIGSCFAYQGDRLMTVRSFYKQAIALLPKRPEAYFLLARHYEWIKEYADSYMLCEQGLTNCSFEDELPVDVEYPGKYGLIFQKAVAAWWWGKTKESRELFHHLADEYRDVMSEPYLNSVQSNMTSLGSGPESQAFRYYSKENHNKLRLTFEGSESIERSYSQVFQDMFVLMCTRGKKNGTYLEVGSAKPFFGNNTALLEQNYQWTGIGIEYKEEFCNEYRQQRKNKILHQDARKINYEKLLKEITDTDRVDYLQIDCEPSAVTFEILLMIPFDKYKFGVITYEHDYYVDITRSYREKSRKYLQSQGYVLVVNDVSPDGISTFEDWWVHPELIDSETIAKLTDKHPRTTNIVNYIYSN